MKNTVFTGAASAIITPLTKDGIDFDNFGKLIDWQIENGIDAVVVAGTTGEGSTLTDEEHRAAIKFAVDRINGRVPVIAGTGSNDTTYAIELSQLPKKQAQMHCFLLPPIITRLLRTVLSHPSPQLPTRSTFPAYYIMFRAEPAATLPPLRLQSLRSIRI